MDRIRGLQGAPVPIPLRNLVRDLPGGPSPAKLAADALAADHKRRTRELQEEKVRLEAKKQKEAFATKIKRERELRERTAAKNKVRDLEAEQARVKAAAEARAARDKYLREEREARDRLQKVLDAEERQDGTPRGRKMSDAEIAAAAKRMRDRWQARWRAAPPPARTPRDPYAEWRGTSGVGEARSRESDDAVVENALDENASEEERAQAAVRRVRAKERDLAARRILAHSSKSLTQALGLASDACDCEVERSVRRVLRLLHPDYSINLALRGTLQHQRIEAAFKRLNGLRDD